MSGGTLTITNARIVTMAGSTVPPTARRGAAMRELGVIQRGEVVVRDGVIESVRSIDEREGSGWNAKGAKSAKEEAKEESDEPRESGPSSRPSRFNDSVIDARGRVVMPGLIDCHTHACWAGSRLDEWEQKLAGRTYLEILAAGGGIMSTVRAVREAPEHQLAGMLRERLEVMLRAGATTIEVKSGYGLDTENELKMLRAIRRAAEGFAGTVVPTALLGHALDPAVPGDAFVRRTIEETLPAVSREFPGIPVDAYCERGAWSPGRTRRLLERAAALGHPLRLHTDQFNSLGMVPIAAQLGARSVDHLEASAPLTLAGLARTATIGVGGAWAARSRSRSR